MKILKKTHGLGLGHTIRWLRSCYLRQPIWKAVVLRWCREGVVTINNSMVLDRADRAGSLFASALAKAALTCCGNKGTQNGRSGCPGCFVAAEPERCSKRHLGLAFWQQLNFG